jgi:hypothetical protein
MKISEKFFIYLSRILGWTAGEILRTVLKCRNTPWSFVWPNSRGHPHKPRSAVRNLVMTRLYSVLTRVMFPRCPPCSTQNVRRFSVLSTGSLEEQKSSTFVRDRMLSQWRRWQVMWRLLDWYIGINSSEETAGSIVTLVDLHCKGGTVPAATYPRRLVMFFIPCYRNGCSGLSLVSITTK